MVEFIINFSNFIIIIKMGNCYQKYEQDNTSNLGLNEEMLNEKKPAHTLIKGLIKNNEIDKANSLVDKFLISSRSPALLYQKLRILYANKEYEQIVEYSNELLKLNPKSLNTMFFKADALRYLGKYNEAMEILDNIIQMNADYVKAYVLKVVLLTKLNLLDEGLEFAHRSILKFGIYPDLLYFKAKILKKLGIFEEINEEYFIKIITKN
jgi:tetratricopeptide (TPR) repeat protein